MTPVTIRAIATAQRTAAMWVIGVVCVQIVFQLALLFETLAPFRVLFRSSAFGISLYAIIGVSGRMNRHPARYAAMAVLAIVACGFVHPQSSNALGAIAQLAAFGESRRADPGCKSTTPWPWACTGVPNYFPMQKREKISPSKSSEVNWPVISLNCNCA